MHKTNIKENKTTVFYDFKPIDDFEPDDDFEIYEGTYTNKDGSFETKFVKFYDNHPILVWTLILILSAITLRFLILYVWKILKTMIYQIVFTVSKAIKDGHS